MNKQNQYINEAAVTENRYDFRNEEKDSYRITKGLTPEIITEISQKKNEPQWMRDFRLRCLDIYYSLDVPPWGPSIEGLDIDNIVTYVKPHTAMQGKWQDVPEDIKDTFEKLGIPQAEQKSLAGVGAQYDSEVVYHNLKEEVARLGVAEPNERVDGGGALGGLLGRPRPAADAAPLDQHHRGEGGVVRGPLLGDELVLGAAAHLALRDLLEARLGADGLSRERRGDLGAERGHHEGVGHVVAGVEVQRAHERLVDVLEGRVHAARPRAELGLPHQDEGAHAEALGHAREHLSRDEADLGLRQLALVHVGEAREEVARHDGAQDGVPEELQALVGRADPPPLGGRGMRERGDDGPPDRASSTNAPPA